MFYDNLPDITCVSFLMYILYGMFLLNTGCYNTCAVTAVVYNL